MCKKMEQLQTITLPATQAQQSKAINVAIICGHQGTGKTELGTKLYKDYKGPRLKTHIDVRSRVVQRWDEKPATLLWVDECRQVTNTLNQAKQLGYRFLMICTQTPGEDMARIISAYGMPAGQYKIIDLSKVDIRN
jgi:hypothetical protein